MRGLLTEGCAVDDDRREQGPLPRHQIGRLGTSLAVSALHHVPRQPPESLQLAAPGVQSGTAGVQHYSSTGLR